MIKMIELKKGLYIVQGDKYLILPKDSWGVVCGEVIAERDKRGDYVQDNLTGIVKSVEHELLVLSPATRRKSYTVDFGHVREVTTEMKEARIPIENMEFIVGMGEMIYGKN